MAERKTEVAPQAFYWHEPLHAAGHRHKFSMSALLLYPLAFAGGLATILSPCILPVLPFVVARTGRSFGRETLPMLLGLAITFTAVAMAGIAGAEWVARTADIGRSVALVFLGIMAVALLSPALAGALSRPFVRLGASLSRDGNASGRVPAPLQASLVGVATGLLWAPCAGPILGLLIGIAAFGGSSARATTLFLVFALGAAASLALALSAGDRLLGALRRAGRSDHMVRRAFGAIALAGVVVIALGWDASLFSKGGLVSTAWAESALVDRIAPEGAAAIAMPVATLPDEGPMPPLDGATGWINTAPITTASLRGRVVVVDFWTFACYNCLNALPHVKELDKKFRAQGVVVLGIHTPELARERIPANVEQAVKRLGVTYPVVLDNRYTIWNAFRNQYWPAMYIVDKAGRIRYHHFGEGAYAEQQRVVEQLLAEPTPPDAAQPPARERTTP